MCGSNCMVLVLVVLIQFVLSTWLRSGLMNI